MVFLYFNNFLFLFYLGKISFSVNGVYFIPKNPNSIDDINTAKRANQFEVLNNLTLSKYKSNTYYCF